MRNNRSTLLCCAFMAVFVFGCSKTDPNGLQKKTQALQEAEADKVALKKEIAAYQADLEHERFLNRELKRQIKELEEAQRIANLAQALPPIPAQTQKASPPPRSQTAPTPVPVAPPISAAIAVASTVPTATTTAPSRPDVVTPEPRKTAPVPALPQTNGPAKSEPAPKKEPPAPQPKKETAQKPEAALPRPASPIEPTKAQNPPEAVPPVATETPPAPTVAVKAKPEAKQNPPAAQPQEEVVKTAEPAKSQEALPQATELQLLNLVNRKQGDRLRLSGEVRNSTSLPAQDVTVVVCLYDDRNTILKQVRLPILGGTPLPAGQMAAFQTELPWDKRISRCQFEVEGVQKVSVSRRGGTAAN